MAKKNWDEMTRAERRVAVAKETLGYLNQDALEPYHGAYVIVGHGVDLSGGSQSAAKKALAAECRVCALGALLLSKLAKFDRWDGAMYHQMGYFQCVYGLADCFSEKALESIEQAFEGWFGGEGCPECQFYEELPHPADRLTAILQNIIDHKGKFNPKQLYEVRMV